MNERSDFRFSKIEKLGIGLVLIVVLALLGFPSVSQYFAGRYEDFDMELPELTKLVVIPWAPQMIGIFLAMVLVLYRHRWIRSGRPRKPVLIGFLLIVGIISVGFCAAGLYAPSATLCSSFCGELPAADSSVSQEAAFKELEPQSLQETKLEYERKIVKEGRISFETKDISKTNQYIDQAVKDFNGYIAEERQHNIFEGRLQLNVTVRIPAEHFDTFLSKILEQSMPVDGKNITVHDVTEEYLDLETRIKNQKDIESRYKDLLQQAKNVQDILAIEKQMGELRVAIESAQGRLKYLQDRTAYSTLEIDAYQVIAKPSRFSGHFTKGLKSGWNNLVWLFVGLVNVWPFLVILLIVYGIVRIRNRQKSPKGN